MAAIAIEGQGWGIALGSGAAFNLISFQLPEQSTPAIDRPLQSDTTVHGAIRASVADAGELTIEVEPDPAALATCYAYGTQSITITAPLQGTQATPLTISTNGFLVSRVPAISPAARARATWSLKFRLTSLTTYTEGA